MIREVRTEMCQENFEQRRLSQSENLNSAPFYNEASGNRNSHYQQKSSQWEEFLSDSDGQTTSFYGNADEDSQEAGNYVFEIPKPKRKKRQHKRRRTPSDSLGESSKRKKISQKSRSRVNYVADFDTSTLKDKSNIPHSAGFVEEPMPQDIRMQKQSTALPNETKSYTKCKSYVSNDSNEQLPALPEKNKTQWDEFLSEEDSSCDDSW